MYCPGVGVGLGDGVGVGVIVGLGVGVGVGVGLAPLIAKLLVANVELNAAPVKFKPPPNEMVCLALIVGLLLSAVTKPIC